MFFAASKIIGLVAEPVTFLVLLGALGITLTFTRFARAGRALATVALGLIALACFSPFSALALRPLEDRFPRPAADAPPPTGIIVLGGAMNEDLSLARGQPALSQAASRLTEAVVLARRYPTARIVFTGGAADLRQTGLDEARGVRDFWLALGVSADRMLFEDKSRNTYENATLTRALVTPLSGERWLLVTSAAHMPRSIGIFRSIGWSLVPYPVDYRTFGDDRDLKLSFNPVESLIRLDVAFHEWVGLVAYRLTGKTQTLFPAP